LLHNDQEHERKQRELQPVSLLANFKSYLIDVGCYRYLPMDATSNSISLDALSEAVDEMLSINPKAISFLKRNLLSHHAHHENADADADADSNDGNDDSAHSSWRVTAIRKTSYSKKQCPHKFKSPQIEEKVSSLIKAALLRSSSSSSKDVNDDSTSTSQQMQQQKILPTKMKDFSFEIIVYVKDSFLSLCYRDCRTFSSDNKNDNSESVAVSSSSSCRGYPMHYNLEGKLLIHGKGKDKFEQMEAAGVGMKAADDVAFFVAQTALDWLINVRATFAVEQQDEEEGVHSSTSSLNNSLVAVDTMCGAGTFPLALEVLAHRYDKYTALWNSNNNNNVNREDEGGKGSLKICGFDSSAEAISIAKANAADIRFPNTITTAAAAASSNRSSNDDSGSSSSSEEGRSVATFAVGQAENIIDNATNNLPPRSQLLESSVDIIVTDPPWGHRHR
jgi:hypothetical protein